MRTYRFKTAGTIVCRRLKPEEKRHLIEPATGNHSLERSEVPRLLKEGGPENLSITRGSSNAITESEES